MGDQQTTKTTVNKLARLELLEIIDSYIRIEVKANIPQLEHLRDNYSYDLTLYENRNNIKNISIHVGHDMIGSQLLLGSSFGAFEFQQIDKTYPNNEANIIKKETCISKIKNLTDHQVIGGIILLIITIIIGWFKAK